MCCSPSKIKPGHKNQNVKKREHPTSYREMTCHRASDLYEGVISFCQNGPKKNQQEEIRLPSYAVVPAAEMVFREERAGRAEAADLFHVRGIGAPAATEELGWLVFFERMTLVVLADGAVFPADLPVLFGVFYNRRFAGFKHAKQSLVIINIRSFVF
jgi:hypothetical protein